MRTIQVNKKTGFAVLNPAKPIIIRDWRGLLFYSTETLVPKVTEFNLPDVGKPYLIEQGFVRELDKPVSYAMLELPNEQRVMKADPFNFQLHFAKNPHKCTVDFKNETITFDNSFLEAPLPVVYFILYHEFAHRYFLSEKYADVLACNFMLHKGFNPSQIIRAQINSLSHRQYERKKYSLEKMLKSNGHS